MVPVALCPPPSVSTSFSTGAEVVGTYMASAGSHTIRNQYVDKSLEYLIDNID